MYVISLDVEAEHLEEVLKQLSKVEEQGICEVRNIFDEEEGELEN